MTKANSKRTAASRANDSKTKTSNSVKRTTARKPAQFKSDAKPAAHQQRRSAPQPTARHESKKAHIIAMLRVPGGVTIEAMARAAKWQPIRSAAFSPVSCARSLALILCRQTARMGASTGFLIARRQRHRRAMRRTRSLAKRATRRSLGDEIAHLRGLDLHGLRARWKSMFRQQVRQLDRRHFAEAQLPGRQHQSPARNDPALGVDQDRQDETKSFEAGRELAHLSRRVRVALPPQRLAACERHQLGRQITGKNVAVSVCTAALPANRTI